MLIITRYAEEEIVIGDDVFIRVCGVDPRTGRVRLGITAPREIPVDRREVRESPDYCSRYRESRPTEPRS